VEGGQELRVARAMRKTSRSLVGHRSGRSGYLRKRGTIKKEWEKEEKECKSLQENLAGFVIIEGTWN